MIAVYPVRMGDRNEELRYSLRSLTNAGIDQVVIVGHKPAWVRNVEHIYVPQEPRLKAKNVWGIYEAIAKDGPDEFVLFNDDIYVMRPIEIKPLHRGKLADLVARNSHKLDVFWRTYREASELLGPDALSYDNLHSPLPLTREGLAEALRVFYHAYAIKTVAGNILNLGGEYAPNAKNPKQFRDRLYLSSSDKSFMTNSMGAFIRSKFPEPSKFEA